MFDPARDRDSESVAREFRRARFTIDGERSFEGWTDGSLWNGWGCPMFGKTEADRLMAALSEQKLPKAEYDAARDAYIVVQEEYDPNDPEYQEVFEGTDIETPEGVKRVYAVGAWSWIWSEVG